MLFGGVGDCVAHGIRAQVTDGLAYLGPPCRVLSRELQRAAHLLHVVGQPEHAVGLGEDGDLDLRILDQREHWPVQGWPSDDDHLLRADLRGVFAVRDGLGAEHSRGSRVHGEFRRGCGGLGNGGDMRQLLRQLASPDFISHAPCHHEGAAADIHVSFTVRQLAGGL